jgi:hypothetical protein
MQTLLNHREVLAAIRKIHQEQKGKHVSDADRAYKRGWRDGLNAIRAEILALAKYRREATK